MAKTKSQKNSYSNDQKENACVKSRKRKASGSLENSRPSKQFLTWEIDNAQTAQLYRELGVEDLENSQSSTESYCLPEKTPSIWTAKDSPNLHLPPVPGAPRILLSSQRDNITSGSESSVEFCSLTTPHIKGGTLKNLDKSLSRKSQKNKTDGYDHFNDLSDEIILTVFHWLPKFVLAKCARVCRKWSRLVSDESLWRKLDLSNRTLGPGVMGNILSRGVTVLRLSKAELEGPVFTGPSKVIRCTRLCKVQYLDLSMAGTTPCILEEIFSVCHDLRKLSMENCEVNDTICGYIGENKNLEVLNLTMCQGISASGLIPITSNCRRLESLNLGWTHLHRHSIVYLCLCLPHGLKKLNLSGCRDNITNEEVLQLVKTCPELQELDLSDSTLIDNQSIVHICDHLPYLEHLSLNRCYQVSPTSLPILSHIPTFLALDVFGMFRDFALQQLKDNMPGVEINSFPLSSIARPTTGIRRSSIWGIRARDNAV